MKNIRSRILAVLAALILLLPLCLSATAEELTEAPDVTILFTHDLHSHLLPSVSEDGGEFGGYARLMTVIKEQRRKYPDAILVDGGDFSMGSLFQTAYATSAIELRMMGMMGYDVTTFGNHEYDYLQSGLKAMLNAAKASGDPVPTIVNANYLPPKEGEDGYDADMHAALDNYGVKDYTIIERGGVYYVIFGIFGFDADDCAPNSGMILQDPVESAKKTVEAAVKECSDTYGADPVVICLSHSGTSDGKGEDYSIAESVDGIDVIISGHTHTTLATPIEVNGTYIVSAGEYGKNLGSIRFTYEDGKVIFKKYELFPINENVEDDTDTAKIVEEFKASVEKDYLAAYGVSFDEVLVNNPYKFDTQKEVGATLHESTVANVYSDAYKWAVEKVTGEGVDLALTAAGVIRESLPTGNVTVSDVFNAASLGVGTEGELVAIWITGKDLKCVLEVDASVQPLMKSAQLYCSGVEYSINTNRMIFNKVDYAMLRKADGTLEKIDDNKMYRVVTGMYAGQMLGSVKETSMGLLSITPRDKDGNPIPSDKLVEYVVRDENGTPLKEWYAIASYLKNMGGEMDEIYAAPDGRKVVYSSFNPADLLRNANIFTYAVIVIAVILIAAILLIVRSIIRRRKKKKVVLAK